MRGEDAPDVREAYDAIAQSYADGYWEENPYQANFEFPATTDLVPDVSGKRVLDAGCGSGVYSQWLVERDADVVGVDASAEMLTEARERVGDSAEFYRSDLGASLEFATTDEFDGVVSGSVLDHVEDWDRLFTEFGRVLSPAGFLVFSVRHPLRNSLEYDDWNYFEVDERVEDWGVEVPHYPRPFSAVVNPLLDAGFRLDELAEPRPTEAFEAELPEAYDRLQQLPYWLCVRAVRS
jgi:SAM-dependent methyltransferase